MFSFLFVVAVVLVYYHRSPLSSCVKRDITLGLFFAFLLPIVPHLLFTCRSPSPLCSVIFPAQTLAQLSQQSTKLQHMIARVQSSLSSGYVLPGQCQVELACIRRLRQLSQETFEKLMPGSLLKDKEHCIFAGVVFKEFADCFLQFVSVLLVNIGVASTRCESRSVVVDCLTRQVSLPSPCDDSVDQAVDFYDSFDGKLGAWRRAIDLVCTVLQCDISVQSQFDYAGDL